MSLYAATCWHRFNPAKPTLPCFCFWAEKVWFSTRVCVVAVDELVCQSAAGRARLWAQSPLLNLDFWSIGIESWDVEGSPWLTSQVPHRCQIFHLLQTHSGVFWCVLMCLDISWLFLARVLFYFYFLVSGYVRLRYGLMAWNANAHQGSTVYIKTSPVDASMDNIYFCATCANFAKACRTTARYSKLKYAETCWNMLKCIELRRVISRSWMFMIVHVSWYFVWIVST